MQLQCIFSQWKCTIYLIGSERVKEIPFTTWVAIAAELITISLHKTCILIYTVCFTKNLWKRATTKLQCNWVILPGWKLVQFIWHLWEYPAFSPFPGKHPAFSPFPTMFSTLSLSSKPYVVSAHLNCLTDIIQMSTHNIGVSFRNNNFRMSSPCLSKALLCQTSFPIWTLTL